MKTSELEYYLPESLIAQHPCERRDQSRLMVLERATRSIHIDIYANVHRWLQRGDCMVLNNTRVIRARLLGHKESGGKVEVFLLRETKPGCWLSLVRPSARIKEGARLLFAAGLSALAGPARKDGKREVAFNHPDVVAHLEQSGEIPLPPYIKRARAESLDAQRYQTIYAQLPGAVAAPTAGLHFTDDVFASLDAAGVSRQYLTLHVGYGTFKPITDETLETHQVDGEEFIFPQTTAEALNAARQLGGRVIAVGTTCARVLETQYQNGAYHAGADMTHLYIYPPYTFSAVDILQTNFHLPKSSLLALVCAFAGRDFVMDAYARAVKENFRFYSYGDVMLIL